MKHRLASLLGAIALISVPLECTTVPTCAAPPAKEVRATHTPKRHFALGFVGEKKFPAGIVKAFTSSPWANTKALPSVDLSEQLAPDDDQLTDSDCTGFGLAHGMYAALFKMGIKNVFFSPKFIYWNERANLGTLTQDSGARIGADGIFTLKKFGACFVNTWPNCEDIFKQPSAGAFAEGKKHLVIQAYNVDNRNGDELERALSAGFVVIYGITLHAEFEDLNPSNFIYHARGAVIGGHCMEAYKYNKATGRARTRNQWGAKKWGDKDEFETSLAIMHSSEVTDCYVLYTVMK